MPNETNRLKIARRLASEGWTETDGGRHGVFKNPARPGVTIAVPRHRTVSPGVARDVAKKAGWI